MANTEPLDPRKVKAFLAVVEAGSLRLAARKLNRSQPAVTLSLRALERDLGRKLFRRVGQRKRLTREGEAFLLVVRPGYAKWLALQDELASALDGEIRGTVRLGAGEAACLYILPEVLRRLREKYKDVDVVLLNQPRVDTFRMLETGELDLGLRTAGHLPPGVDAGPCRESPRLVIAARGTRLPRMPSVRALAGHPLVAPPPGSMSRILLERAFRREGAIPRVAVEAGGWEVIKAAVRAGLGIAIVPALCLRAADRRRLTVARADPRSFPPERYDVLCRAYLPLTPAARTLFEMLGKSQRDS